MRKLNINKFLKLQIQEKLAIAFVGLSILPVCIVGIFGISSNVKSLRRVAIQNLQHDLETTHERLNAFLRDMESNAYLITSSLPFRQFLKAVDDGDSLRVAKTLQQVLPNFLSFARYKKIFYQIKFIDSRGNIIFTIENDHSDYKVLPERMTRNVGTSFYLYFAKRIPPNLATFLPVELKEKVSGRLFPCISSIIPLQDHSFRGILVFHIYAKHFFKILEEKMPHSPPGTIMLVNADGYYLYHSQKKRDWNKLLASKEVLNLQASYGKEVAARLLSQKQGDVYEVNDQIIANSPVFGHGRGMSGSYVLLKSVSKAAIFAPVNSFKWFFVGLLIFFLVVSLTLAYLATRQLIEPIKKLEREAKIIAHGNYRSRVEIKTFDEIEELARQFNIMAESLEKHEARVVRQKQLLREKVQQRTKELQDEKNKLQVILDNVPSGFMLLDSEFRILSASAALESIMERPTTELLHRPCSEVTGCAKGRGDCLCAKVFSTGKVHSETFSRIRSNGEERLLENLAIPLHKNGRVAHVLEIVTDVTERQRMQERLIRSEKLAATGEMAAVIAHAMRNSMTTVRMILQLFAQNEAIPKDEREPYDVALNSLEQIERLLNELLHLSRPTRLERRPANINRILNESIEFAWHQIARENITINLKLEHDLPDLLIDADRLKEAFVNLLLNAAQAIQGKGRISIQSVLYKLTRELRDLGEVSADSAESDVIKIKEVVLKKDTRTVRIDIEDSGCGISEQHLQRVFDPFFTTKVDGTGLGLSFVKRVVNEHNGVIRVRSQLYKGSCFSIFLPIE